MPVFVARFFAAFILFAASLATLPANAAATIEIQKPWAKAQSDITKQGGIFLNIVNHSGSGDKLVSVATPAAKIAQLHNNKQKHGKMRMRRKTTLDVQPNANIPLAQDGLHIMLMNLAEPLTPGMTFPLTLNFEKAGAIEVKVVVR